MADSEHGPFATKREVMTTRAAIPDAGIRARFREALGEAS